MTALKINHVVFGLRVRRDLLRVAAILIMLGVVILAFQEGSADAGADSLAVVKIGALANRGSTECQSRWRPTAVYLERHVEEFQFEIVPLKFDELYSAVNEGKVDFLIANSSMQGDRQRCLEAGMDDYISKPVQPKELKEKLDRWIAPDPKRRISAYKPEMPYVAASAEDSGIGEIFLPDELLERLMGDEEVARTIIAGFLSDIPEQIAKFKKCVDAGDSVAAHRLAHTIKGAAGNIGAPALRRVAFELEELGEAADLEEAVKKLPQLDEEFGSLRQKLMQKGWF